MRKDQYSFLIFYLTALFPGIGNKTVKFAVRTLYFVLCIRPGLPGFDSVDL